MPCRRSCDPARSRSVRKLVVPEIGSDRRDRDGIPDGSAPRCSFCFAVLPAWARLSARHGARTATRAPRPPRGPPR